MTSLPTEDYSALQGYSNDVSFTKEPTSDDTFLPNMKYKKNTLIYYIKTIVLWDCLSSLLRT